LAVGTILAGTCTVITELFYNAETVVNENVKSYPYALLVNEFEWVLSPQVAALLLGHMLN